MHFPSSLRVVLPLSLLLWLPVFGAAAPTPQADMPPAVDCSVLDDPEARAALGEEGVAKLLDVCPVAGGSADPYQCSVTEATLVNPGVSTQYQVFDQKAGCAYDLVDISATGTLVVTGDDTSSGPRALSEPFAFFGTSYTSLVMATNGYISTWSGDTGPDLSNDCPLPRAPSTGGGARIYPLHDDWALYPANSGGGFMQYFPSCPRTGSAGPGSCTVFMWHNASDWTADPGDPQWDFETILYHASGEIVHLIGPGNPEHGLGSTTGMQNASATVGITYACNAANSIPDNAAICFAPLNRPFGWLFFDANGDGIRQPEETGGPHNVGVHLLQGGIELGFTYSTPDSGWFEFPEMPMGDYCIQADLPAAYTATGPNPRCFTHGNKVSRNIGVSEFAATIGDTVYSDANLNGAQDAGEIGIPDVTLDLLTAGTVLSSTTSGPDGTYTFVVTAPGEYTVEVTDTGGALEGLSATHTPEPVVISAAGANLDADFGFGLVCGSGQGAISGRVWLDEDADGAQAPGDRGIGGVKVCSRPLGWGTQTCARSLPDGTYGMCVTPATHSVTVARKSPALAGLSPTTPEFHLPVVIHSGGRFFGGIFGYRNSPR